MADIAPFRGLLYNQKVVGDLAAVVTPPFDVISPEDQEMYHQRHPYNMIRLILGRQKPGDSEDNNWYTRAGAALRDWQRQEVFSRDLHPAVFDYEIDYQEPGNLSRTRRGLICLVRLEEFSQGTVYPHERTYENTKSERLKLMLASQANLSQVFALYSDPDDLVARYLMEDRKAGPVFDFSDLTGQHHRMWRVTREDVIARVQSAMRDKPLFIADGHHRYETALNYQRLLKERYPERGEQASFNYILMHLSNMNQAGLSILSTHRLCVHLPQFEMTSFLARAAEYFEVERFPFAVAGRFPAVEEFVAKLGSAGGQHFIGVYEASGGELVLLKLREDLDHDFWRGSLPQPLQNLDVIVLTELVLKQLLRVDVKTLNDESSIQYSHDVREAIEQVDRGLFQVAFLINPTRIEQVQEVASAGLIMPHKSTYFYPKVIDGTVLNILDTVEDVVV
jgi:uncharacterized protein (DUF1015 family)